MIDWVGKTIAAIREYGSHELDIEFTDGTTLYVWSRGDWGEESTVYLDAEPYEYTRVDR